ncbi:MAG: lipopolysaccharide biosynthesis protein [Candidatus Thermochlorobacter sp.]
MHALIKILKGEFHSYTAKQTYLLYTSQLLGMLLSGFTYYLLAKHLSKEAFGDRELILKIVTFMLNFFEFGIFTAGSRLLAIERNRQVERQIVSGLMFIGLGIALSFAVVLMLLGLFIDTLFKTNQDLTLIVVCFSLPLSFSVFTFFFQLIYQGTNEILKLSFFNFVPRFGHVVLLVAWLLFDELTLLTSLSLYSIVTVVVTLALILKASPSLQAWKACKAILINETKQYGLPVYLGRLIGMTAYNLDSLILATCFGSNAVGNYAIMMFFVTPISAFSDAFLSASFKRMAGHRKISKDVYWINFLGLAGLTTAYFFIGPSVFGLVFQKYRESLLLMYPLAVAMLITGLTKPYNAFLSIMGEGKKLQGTAIALAISSTLLNFSLIPAFAEIGAALASVCVVTINLIVHIILYKLSIREKEYVS